jgi:hypothetical protein
MQNRSIWHDYNIEKNGLFYSNIGELKMWCRFMQEEVQIAYEHSSGDLEPATPQPPPENISWSRWPFKNEHRTIQLTPLPPDRAVVIKPESSFRILKHKQVKVCARVPVWIQISVISRKGFHLTLTEIPSMVLSNTWFGSFLEGELCYAISSGLRQRFESDTHRQHMIMCPILLDNKSDEELLIDKICLHVDNLSLYIDNRQLWSDETRIVYKGSEEVSQVSVSGLPPDEATSANLITAPRNPVKKNFLAKTFSTLKDLPGLGLFED